MVLEFAELAQLPARRCPRLLRIPAPEIDIILPNNQRQHRTLHIQKDVLPYALCYLLCPMSAALTSISRMYSSCGRKSLYTPMETSLEYAFCHTAKKGGL